MRSNQPVFRERKSQPSLPLSTLPLGIDSLGVFCFDFLKPIAYFPQRMNKQLILDILKGNKIQASIFGDGFLVTIDKVPHKFVTLERAQEACSILLEAADIWEWAKELANLDREEDSEAQAKEAQVLRDKALNILVNDFAPLPFQNQFDTQNDFRFLPSESEMSALAFVSTEEKSEKEFDGQGKV